MTKKNITVKEKELIDKLNNRADSAESTKILEKMKAESAAMTPSAPYSMNEDTRVRTHNQEKPEKEQVNHPDHYNDYDIEVIEMMERIFGMSFA